MLVNILCILAVAIPLSSAQYIPSIGACPGQFMYVYEKGQIFAEIQIPYDSSASAILLSVQLVYAQKVPDAKVGIDMIQPGEKIPKEGLLYKLTFPNQKVIPAVTEMKVNGKLLCQGPPEKPLLDGPFEFGSTPVTVNHRTRFFGSSRKMDIWYDEVEEKEGDLLED